MAEQANRPTELNNQEPQNGEFFAGALLGAMAGGLAALLMTPKNGAEMRRLMADYFKEWEAEAEVFAEDIKEMTDTFRKVLEEYEVTGSAPAPQPRPTTSQWIANTTAQVQDKIGEAKQSVGDVVESLRHEWQSANQAEQVPQPNDLFIPPTAAAETHVKMGATEAHRMSGGTAVAEPEDESLVKTQDLMPPAQLRTPTKEEPTKQTPPEMEEPAFMRAAKQEVEASQSEEHQEPTRQEVAAEPEKPSIQEQAAMAWSGHRPNRRQGSYSFSLHSAPATTETTPLVAKQTAVAEPKPAEKPAEPTLMTSVEEVKKEVAVKPEAKATTESKPAYQRRVLSQTTPKADLPIEPIASVAPVPDKPRTKRLFYKKK